MRQVRRALRVGGGLDKILTDYEGSRVRVFKTKRLARWAAKEEFSDEAIWEAAKVVAVGIFEAGLGQNLFKKRIPRPGGGNSSLIEVEEVQENE